MRKEVSFILLISCIILYNLILVSSAVLNVCNSCNFTMIQSAINNASSGDIINVSVGVYNERLVINKNNLTIKSSDDAINTIIDLNQPSETTGIAIYVNDTIFDGFTIKNISTISSHAQYALRIRGSKNRIINNIIIGQPSRDWWSDEEDSGINLDGTTDTITSNNIVEYNEIYNFSAMGIQVVGSGGNYNAYNNTIKNNKIRDIDYYAITIDRSSNNTIENNSLNNIGPSGHFLDGYPAIGIVIFGAKSSGTKIISQTVNGTEIGIVLSSSQNIKIENCNINGNSVRGVQISYTSWLGDIPDNNTITNCIITGNPTGILARHGSGSIGPNNKINYNNLAGNTIGINNTSPTFIDAKFNWWGDCEPSSKIFGNVSFSPWLGACAFNKTTDKNCIFPYDNVILYANVSSQICIGNVWFGADINGTWKNYTGSISNSGIGNYSVIISKSNFTGGENVYWTVFADDCYNHTSQDGTHSFYVNRKTSLTANKSNPDGLNGWYVTEPFFTLINPDASSIFYRWDGKGPFIYNGSFGLENIINSPPKESAGILELTYWSNVSCGNESKQNQTLKVDLTNLTIQNLIPANNSIVYNNKKPTIQAYLDEVYQSNSGIDKSSVLMKVNGVVVDKNVFDADTLDVVVRYNPPNDLLEGLNNVSINATDKAGRYSELSWFFYINTSLADFNLSVYSPENKTYGNKKVKFNITTTTIVEKIEYINLNEIRTKWKTLCLKCKEYGNSKEKRIILIEGVNNITIRASDSFGNQKENNITLFIDSIEPKIIKTLPPKNSFFNGSRFYIKYNEANLKNITLFYGRDNDIRNVTKTDCESGKDKECVFLNINLSDYNRQEILYGFNISDVVRTISSKQIKIKTDTSVPNLTISSPANNFSYPSAYKGNILFNLTINEKAKLEYYDNSDLLPVWKNLCTNCDKYAKIKKFSAGEHNISIRATDKAGNYAEKEINFVVE